jgi:hypothetical protein
MTRALQEAAQDLVSALNEACAIHAQQKQSTAALHSNTESTEQNFVSLLTAQQSNPLGEETQKRRREMSERMRGAVSEGNRLTDIKAASSQWELSLCDSQTALMRLYAFSEAREVCERIENLLRDLRLPGFAETPEIKPPAPPDFGPEPDSEEERKKRMARFALDFMQGMTARYKQVTQFHEEQSQRAETLINQAREQAEALTRRLNL